MQTVEIVTSAYISDAVVAEIETFQCCHFPYGRWQHSDLIGRHIQGGQGWEDKVDI